jgi:hydrogenase-4 component E
LTIIVAPLYDEIVGLLGISVILSALYMLGQTYIDPTIRAIAIQSFLISALLVILFLHTEDVNLLYLALITAVMRGVVFPRIMLYQVRRFKHKLRETGVGRKTPLLVITGIMIAIIGYALFRSVVFPFLTNTQLSVPFVLLLLGFFLIITRRNTLGQMCGYVQQENAVLYIGALIAPGIPFLIEFAVVLDILGVVLVAVILSAQRDIFQTLEPADIDQLSG